MTALRFEKETTYTLTINGTPIKLDAADAQWLRDALVKVLASGHGIDETIASEAR